MSLLRAGQKGHDVVDVGGVPKPDDGDALVAQFVASHVSTWARPSRGTALREAHSVEAVEFQPSRIAPGERAQLAPVGHQDVDREHQMDHAKHQAREDGAQQEPAGEEREHDGGVGARLTRGPTSDATRRTPIGP